MNLLQTLSCCLILVNAFLPNIGEGRHPQKKPLGSGGAFKGNMIGNQFDDTQSSLPLKFKDNSFEALYKALAIPKKGEFESSSEYESRRLSVPTGKYAFVYKNPLNIKYSMDEQAFTIGIRAGYSKLKLGGSERIIEIETRSKSLGSYLGSNAYGVKKQVSNDDVYSWGIAFPVEHSSEDLEFTISMPSAKASLIKNRLKILIIINVGPECIPVDTLDDNKDPLKKIATSRSSHEATIDSPSNLTQYYCVIYPRNSTYWLFDSNTGEIIQKYNAFGKPIQEIEKAMTSH